MNPTSFSWTDPTTNTDGTPIAPGEITGYLIGIRSADAAGSVAGTYTITAAVSSPTATTELFSALGTVLAPGKYASAIQTIGPADSAWSAEVTFTIAAPVPNPPSGFSVA
jgi:hypothetical protein